MSKAVKEHWKPLFALIGRAEDRISAALEERVHDVPTDKKVVLGEGNVPVETDDRYTKPLVAEFYLVMKSGAEKCEAYMGTVDKPNSSYSKSIMDQLEHQTGLRLLELQKLGRELEVTGKLIGYEQPVEVTEDLVGGLLKSEDRELDIVKDPIKT